MRGLSLGHSRFNSRACATLLQLKSINKKITATSMTHHGGRGLSCDIGTPPSWQLHHWVRTRAPAVKHVSGMPLLTTDTPGYLECLRSHPNRRIQFAFPGYEHPPTIFRQGASRGCVTSYIALKLLHPIARVRLRRGGHLAPWVPVPKAAVHENGRPILRQDDVWPPRQAASVEPESKSQPVESLSQS